MTGPLFILAALGCGCGALLRYGISRVHVRAAFPWPTIASNVLGSALMGTVAAAVLEAGAPVGWLIVLGLGVAGGLSTFSTLGVDAVILWRAGRRHATAVYLIATVVSGLAAAGLGWWSVVSLA